MGVLTQDYCEQHTDAVEKIKGRWFDSVGSCYREYGELLAGVRVLDKHERRRLMQLSCMLHSNYHEASSSPTGWSATPDLRCVATDMWAARLWGCRGTFEVLLKERPDKWRWRCYDNRSTDLWHHRLQQCAALVERDWGGVSPVSYACKSLRAEERNTGEFKVFSTGLTATTIAHCLHTANLEFMALSAPQFRSVANAFLSMPLLEPTQCRLTSLVTHLINFVARWQQAAGRKDKAGDDAIRSRFPWLAMKTEHCFPTVWDNRVGQEPQVNHFFVVDHYDCITPHNYRKLLDSGLAVKPTIAERRLVYAMIATVMPYNFNLTEKEPYHVNYAALKSPKKAAKLPAVPAAAWRHLVAVAKSFTHAYTECLQVTAQTVGSSHSVVSRKLDAWRRFRQATFTDGAVNPHRGLNPQFVEAALNTSVANGWFGAADKVLTDGSGDGYSYTVFSLCPRVPTEVDTSEVGLPKMWQRSTFGYTHLLWQLYRSRENHKFTIAGIAGNEEVQDRWQRFATLTSLFMQDYRNRFTPTMFVPDNLKVFY